MPPLSVGIDFGGTSIKMGVVSGSQLVSKAEPIVTADFPKVTDLIDQIASNVEAFRREHSEISAIGVGVPGFVDFKEGRIHRLTNVPGWENIYLRTELEKRLNLPTVIENDANAMAYAEWKLGSGLGLSHLIALTLGTGVGGGLIIDGHLARGAHSVGGELGHISIDYQGLRGPYNNPGGLEEYLGNREFTARAKKQYQDAGKTPPEEELNPKVLAQAATEGDEVALQLWDDFATFLACALTSSVFLLNPEAIILGGGVAQAGPLLFEPLKEKLFSQIGKPFRENLQVLPAAFGNEAGILGCAALAIENAQNQR